MSALRRAVAVALLGLGAALTTDGPVAAQPRTGEAAAVTIPAGTYRPLFRAASAADGVAVPAFRIDRLPVTNGDFLRFVRANPEWSRDRIPRVMAEQGYLAQWQTAQTLGPDAEADQPVTRVSWFAARAYCAARGARLPTEAEWERAAAASRTAADGSNDPAWRAELLAAYARPMPARLPRVGAGMPNAFGVHDLHGLVWEWVHDFNATIASSTNGADGLRFCGASGSSARDATDFVAFERAALRSSLRASFVLKNLGFRCASSSVPGATS